VDFADLSLSMKFGRDVADGGHTHSIIEGKQSENQWCGSCNKFKMATIWNSILNVNQ
jgi:hypothetical protein